MNLLLFEPAATMPNWLVAILFGVPFIGGILFYSYKTRHARSWRKGIFPIKLKPTEDNFLEAYLALGAKLIILNYQNLKVKQLLSINISIAISSLPITILVIHLFSLLTTQFKQRQ